jgi:outer membrane protein assembly factor BamB
VGHTGALPRVDFSWTNGLNPLLRALADWVGGLSWVTPGREPERIDTCKYYLVAYYPALQDSISVLMPVAFSLTRLGRRLAQWALLLAAFHVHAYGGEATPPNQNWPMFRGQPSLLGVSAAALPDKPVPLWKFTTKGPVKSSAAIVSNRVYIGSDDANLYALDAKTGAKLWEYPTTGPIESSPLVLDGRVYVGSGDSSLYAVSVAGKLIWKYETGDKILGAPNWHSAGPGQKTSILVGSYDYKLHSVDAETGKSNWVFETGNYINGSPAVYDGKTVFGGCDALLHVISLANGQKVKEIDAGAYIAGSVAVSGTDAFVGHYENAFLGVDLANGQVRWTYRDRAFPYFSSPAVSQDMVVFGGRDKRLHCVRRADGQVRWTFPTRGKVDSSPVICGDKVVVGSDDGTVYIVSMTTGKELWSYEIGRPVTSSPAVVPGLFVVGSDDGTVYGFGTKGQL